MLIRMPMRSLVLSLSNLASGKEGAVDVVMVGVAIVVVVVAVMAAMDVQEGEATMAGLLPVLLPAATRSASDASSEAIRPIRAISLLANARRVSCTVIIMKVFAQMDLVVLSATL